MSFEIVYDFDEYRVLSAPTTTSSYCVTVDIPESSVQSFAVMAVYGHDTEFYITTPEKFQEEVQREIQTYYIDCDDEDNIPEPISSNFTFTSANGQAYNVKKTYWEFDCDMSQYELYEFVAL